MSTEFCVRKVLEKDLEDLNKLALELIQKQKERNKFFYDLTITRATDIRGEICNPSCCIFVAECNDKIIGYSEVRLVESDYWFEVQDYALLVDMFVDKTKCHSLPGHAIVFKLFKACEDWAIEHGRKYLCADVYAFNTTVRKLLCRGGFEEYKIKFVKDLDNI